MSEVEHAFSAHTMQISKHLNPDETEDLIEAVQQLVDSHIRQARLRKSMSLHGSTYVAPMAQYGTMQSQRALDMQLQSNNYPSSTIQSRHSTNQIPSSLMQGDMRPPAGTVQSRQSTNQIPPSHSEMGPPASTMQIGNSDTVQNACNTVQNYSMDREKFQGGGLTMLHELAPMEPPGRAVPFTRV